MPYITKSERQVFDNVLNKTPIFKTKGELEYCVFKLMKKYMIVRSYKYTSLHDVVYAVQHCADEFRRRYLDKRENEAIESNGDIDV